MLCPAGGFARRIVRVSLPLLLILCSVAARTASAETLDGRVVDPHARAVAGAQVLVLSHGAVIETTRTAPDGHFGPVTLSPGEYDVIVAATGLRSPARHVTVTKGGAATVEVPLALSAVGDSVVVSASSVDVPLSHATESVTVIDRASLDVRQIHTVADALRDVPGFGVVVSGAPGGLTSVFPRGGESNYSLVLVDGIPQNAFGGGYDFAHLNTADVERIEVVRGPQSALFGGGAIGGVVQVITRQGGPLKGQVSFEGGGYGTSRFAGAASGSHHAWRWGAAVDRFDTKGDTRVFPSIGDGSGRVSNDDYDRVAGSGSLGWSDGPGRSVRVDVRAGHNERGAPGAYGSDPANLFNTVLGGIDTKSRGTSDTREVGVSATLGSTAVRQHAQFTWSGLDSTFAYQGGVPSLNNTHRTSGRYQLDFGPRAVAFSAGGEVLREQADNTFITTTGFVPVPVTRLVSGLFVEARPALGNRVFLTAGARLERIARRALPADDPDAFSPRPALGEDIVWSANPKLSAAWFLTAPSARNWTKIRASAGTGIRPPDAFELSSTDNPALKPERSRSLDAGVEQAIGGSGTVVDATAFYNRYEDLIFTVGTAHPGASPYRTDNLANAMSRGLELGLSWRGARGLSARGAWTLLHTEVLAADGLPTVATKSFYHVGDPLVRRPRRQGSLEIDWTAAKGAAFLAINGRGKVADLEPDFASSVFTNPGYAVLALGGSFKLRGGLEVFGRVENALNRAYEEVFGYPALGRRAVAGVRVAAGR